MKVLPWQMRVPQMGSQQELIHILILGQSNGAGQSAFDGNTDVMPLADAGQNFGNLMLSGGMRSGDKSSSSTTYMGSGSAPTGINTNEMGSLVPLVELVESNSTGGGNGNTIAKSLTDWLSQNTGKRFVVSNVAIGSASYSTIKKNTYSYAYALQQIRVVRALSQAQGYQYKFGCCCVIHGETDGQTGNTSSTYLKGYASRLLEWQSDLETDIKAIVPVYLSNGTIPFFVCQMASNGFHFTTSWSVTGGTGNLKYPTSNLDPGGYSGYGQFWLQNSSFGLSSQPSPKRIYLVSPRYYLYSVDGIHLLNKSYQWHGEQYAKAIKKVLFDGSDWNALQPSNVYWSDASGVSTGGSVSQYLVVEFLNHSAELLPLVFDKKMIYSPETFNFGFRYVDLPSGSTTLSGSPGNSSASISSVVGLNPNNTRLLLTLTTIPSGTSILKHIRYASDATSVPNCWSLGSIRGALRDSDSSVSRHGFPLYNFCAQFYWML